MLVFSLLVSVNVTRKDVNFHGMETVFIISDQTVQNYPNVPYV